MGAAVGWDPHSQLRVQRAGTGIRADADPRAYVVDDEGGPSVCWRNWKRLSEWLRGSEEHKRGPVRVRGAAVAHRLGPPLVVGCWLLLRQWLSVG